MYMLHTHTHMCMCMQVQNANDTFTIKTGFYTDQRHKLLLYIFNWQVSCIANRSVIGSSYLSIWSHCHITFNNMSWSRFPGHTNPIIIITLKIKSIVHKSYFVVPRVDMTYFKNNSSFILRGKICSCF